MSRGTYQGGSTLVSRSGWVLRPGQSRIKDTPSKPSQPERKEIAKARKSSAKAAKAAREAASHELARRAADILRADGLSEPEIRKRLKLRRTKK